MTDASLAVMLTVVREMETSARASWDAMTGDDVPEYQAAMATVRQAGALRRSLEQWILGRVVRQQKAG